MGMDRVLAGRDGECAALRRALAAAPGGRPPLILVSGEAGAGKTTLVEHVLARTGMPVLPGRAAEWAGTAYDVLARALRPAIRDTAGPVPPVLALAYRDGVVALTGADAALVPDGIREAVLLRAAGLSGEERRLLETAAVAGQEFDIDPVLAVCGLPAWPDGFTGAGLLTEVRDGGCALRGARLPRRRPGAADGAGALARGRGRRCQAGRARPAGPVRGDVLGLRRGGNPAPRARRRA